MRRGSYCILQRTGLWALRETSSFPTFGNAGLVLCGVQAERGWEAGPAGRAQWKVQAGTEG